MSYGFSVKNSGGYLQLNENISALRVVEQGAATAVADALSGYSFSVNHDLLSSAKTIFVHKIGSALSGSVSVSGGVSRIGVSGPGVYEYVIADTVGWSNPTGYGLAIYSQSGSVAFNSNDKLVVIPTVLYKAVNFSTPNGSEPVAISIAPYPPTSKLYFPLFACTATFLTSGSSRKLINIYPSINSSSSVTVSVYNFDAPPAPGYSSSTVFVLPFGVVT